MDDDGNVSDGAPRARAASRRRPPSAGWNPHAIVLVAGGLALVAVGVNLYRSALRIVYTDFASRRDGIGESTTAGVPDAADELIRMQVEWTVGPLLILFGIASVLLGVVVLAVRWNRARGE